MTIRYVLLAGNFGPQSVCHVVAQLFAVGCGFETRPGLQLKNSLKPLVNPAVNRRLNYRRMTACTWVWIAISIRQFDRRHNKTTFHICVQGSTWIFTFIPQYSDWLFKQSDWARKRRLINNVPFLPPVSGSLQVIRMLFTLFDIPVVTSKQVWPQFFIMPLYSMRLTFATSFFSWVCGSR